MSNTPPTPDLELPDEHYLNATYGSGIRSWLLTTDHKRIALLYLASVTVFFFIGGVLATMIRIHLLTPGGALVTPETYNKLFTMHGLAMIFFFLIPSIPADRKSTRLNSSHQIISYAVFCLKKKTDKYLLPKLESGIGFDAGLMK